MYILKFGPVVQEMSFKGIYGFSSGRHFVGQSQTGFGTWQC